MTTKTNQRARIQTNTDGEARCAHRNLWGSVCRECFQATPWLQDVYGMVYQMTGAEWADNEDPTHGGACPISEATPAVQVITREELQVGDRIHGYRSPVRPHVVKRFVITEDGTFVETEEERRLMVTDWNLCVVRSAA